MPIHQLVGGPSCGKTTAYEELKKHFKSHIPEMARIILANPDFGPSIADCIRRGNYAEFQRRVSEFHALYESVYNDDETVEDAGTICALAYSMYLDEGPEKDSIIAALDKHLKEHKPVAAYLFESLPYKADGVRHDDKGVQKVIQDRVRSICSKYGIPLYDVPKAPLQERVSLILSLVKDARRKR